MILYALKSSTNSSNIVEIHKILRYSVYTYTSLNCISTITYSTRITHIVFKETMPSNAVGGSDVRLFLFKYKPLETVELLENIEPLSVVIPLLSKRLQIENGKKL